MTPPAYRRADHQKATKAPHKATAHKVAPQIVTNPGTMGVGDEMPEAGYEAGMTYSESVPSEIELPRLVQGNGELGRSASWHVRVAKRVVDIVGSVFLGIAFSPLILVVAILIHRAGGSVIYRHKRIGQGGQTFDCLKFRTMVPNADRLLHDLLEKDDRLKAEWLEGHKLRDDPRVTAVGRFLRRTSLDELPQIWNVLRGEMSLVGPRPIVREELLRYGRSAGVYTSVKPGVTGLWQTMGRNDTDYRRRVAIDVYYVRNRTLLLDAYILMRTIQVVMAGDGAY